MEKKKNKVAITLYVFACVFGLFTLYTLITGFAYIGELASSGSIVVSEEFGNILSYLFGNSGAYLFDTLVLGALGYMISANTVSEKKKETKIAEEKQPEAAVVVEEIIEADGVVTEVEGIATPVTPEAEESCDADTEETIIEAIEEVTEEEPEEAEKEETEEKAEEK